MTRTMWQLAFLEEKWEGSRLAPAVATCRDAASGHVGVLVFVPVGNLHSEEVEV